MYLLLGHIQQCSIFISGSMVRDHSCLRTAGRLVKPYGMPGVKPSRLTTFKANTIHAILLFWPDLLFFWVTQIILAYFISMIKHSRTYEVRIHDQVSSVVLSLPKTWHRLDRPCWNLSDALLWGCNSVEPGTEKPEKPHVLFGNMDTSNPTSCGGMFASWPTSSISLLLMSGPYPPGSILQTLKWPQAHAIFLGDLTAEQDGEPLSETPRGVNVFLAPRARREDAKEFTGQSISLSCDIGWVLD